MVPQRPFLFSDTIASNISLERNPDAERIDWAVEAAALTPDLQVLPGGLETVVGERGIMLSGGQRQRVALARGLYRTSDVLILDDVLSAVDHHTESMLVETVADLARHPDGPTVLISSHRLSALRQCDTILVLEGGRLVDSGPHAELVRRPGLYRDVWRVQSQAAAAEDEVARLGFDHQFRRKWRYYLNICEAGFRERVLGDLQLVLTREGNRRLAGDEQDTDGQRAETGEQRARDQRHFH